MRIEKHENCNFDFLRFHSGLGTHTPVIATFCSSSLPGPLDTPGNEATVYFHSDEISSDSGVMIAYTLMSATPGCGGSYVKPKGVIASPRGSAENGNYDHNMICEYEIQMPKNSRVKIEFVKFKIEAATTCTSDKVEVNLIRIQKVEKDLSDLN